ncbi:MAG TPA: pyrimidine-nucleoside phosphorylase [Syntrophomonadaceae bacterium]|nr:pyrimidine-nucleoside phosphorylase [Syntrophomonadaceae bacterium]
MRMIDIIQKKKSGQVLTNLEINFAVSAYTKGEIPDYQMAALLMATYFKGMDKQEIADLTMAMVNSGDIIDLSSIKGIKVDKHSTGGVGDKISLIVVPLVAAVGVPVAKMSGRGLGHTGGTIDKLEAIKGFRTELTDSEFIHNVNNFKMAIAGQTGNLVPADKKLYALRDVTATVDSIPLIASSIMSKKIAAGADAIVLDVKIGSGAFMKTLDEAKELAQTMVDIGKSLKIQTIAVITNMNQPLGHEVGNANEVREAIEVLKNQGSQDETEIALTIAAHMAILGGAFEDFKIAYNELSRIIESGQAINKFKELIEIQGGDPTIIDDLDKLPQAKNHIEIKAKRSGFIQEIDAEKIGTTAMQLGAGRKTKDDDIDFAAGVTICKKVGEQVNADDIICVLHTNLDESKQAEDSAKDAFTVGDIKPAPQDNILGVIS